MDDGKPKDENRITGEAPFLSAKAVRTYYNRGIKPLIKKRKCIGRSGRKARFLSEKREKK